MSETSSATPAGNVSVVVTTYNYANYIADALDSVLGQTHPPGEIVVIDDGSTDDTVTVVARYADAGVRYVRQENLGAGAARNRGIAETTGDLIAFLDADDIWLPDKLEHQVDYLAQHPDAVLVSGQMIWWHVRKDTRHVERFGVGSARDPRRELVVRNVVGNPSMTLIRRSALERAGWFDASLRWGQDWELFIRLARVGAIGWLADPVITYRWHGGSLSHGSRWDRLDLLWRIACRAAATHEPAWERVVLRERAWSLLEFDRARLVLSDGGPRLRQLRHACLAFVVWPFDDTRERATFAIRSLIGERIYDALREKRCGR
jgi:glycosyltransferase involved in cell wall biosynthesis